MSPQPKPGILEISPYVAGRGPDPGGPPAIKLSSNESALGPSPAAVSAFEAASADIAIYPEGSARLLREAIANVYGLDAGRIVCGNGSEELIALLARIYLSPDDEVIFTRYGFLVYRIATLGSSARPVVVAEDNLRANVDHILAAVTPRTRIVYLANPNNPTGTCLPASEIERLHEGLPDTVLLVLDAAYAEYVQREDYEPGTDLVNRFDNVVMLRTFSKIYALAGLRVGWAFCPPAIADALNRLRGAFNISVPAQRTAMAALHDRDHLARSIAHNTEWKIWLTNNIRAAGITVGESEGNFLLLQFDSPRRAEAADAFLTKRGFILRPVANYELPHCLRLTIGTPEANRGVGEALADFMRQETS
ncbi:MAG TPA: histidinol-phosphate transaminase [Rhizomicrobium sp.]|jgi:histidinol-phosphate aminotransferase|nr:histidinol-phosphate transaminase [Rhizomicrobium sp.]